MKTILSKISKRRPFIYISVVVILGLIGILGYLLFPQKNTDVIVLDINTYYVATNGNDVSGDGSIDNPWATLGYADSRLSPGDTVYIRGGVYNEIINPTTSGAQGSPITWIAYPGEEPEIDGYGLSTGRDGLVGMNNGIGYIVWDGIKVYRSDGTGIMIQVGSHNITIQNCIVEDTQQAGIRGYSDSALGHDPIRNLTIHNCEVFNVNQSLHQEAISIMGVDGVEVSYCTIHDSYKEGIDFKDGVRNGSMHHNTVYNMENVAFYIDSFDSFCDNINMYNNVAYDCTSVGIALATEQGGTLSNIKVYNNLVYNCKDGLSVLDYTARPGTHTKTAVQIFNNTFVDNSRWQIWVQDPAENFINLVVANNLFAHSSAINVFKWDDWGNLAGATLEYNLFQAGIGFGSNIITGDPLFLARGNNDYSLQAASPAVDSGYTAHTPSDDINGNARPSGSGYDIGAYELTDASAVN